MKKFFFFLIVCFSFVNIYPQNWEKVDTIFSPSGVIVKSFTAPAFADLDEDGDFDLLLGNLGDRADFYENIGTLQFPKFKMDNSLLDPVYNGTPNNADYPAFVDLDGDSDIDMVIGGYNGILYYENIGTKTAPEFQKVDSFFTEVNPLIGTDARPAFIDIDHDGDYDLFVGVGESLIGPAPTAGITLAFRNNGDANNPIWVQDNSLAANIVDAGLNAYPAFVDLDGDSDFDLLIGRDLQTFIYYKNTGNQSAPVWTRDYTVFAGIESTNYWKDPWFCDLDGDADFDLIYGTDDGDILFYSNIGTVNNPVFQYNPAYFSIKKVSGSSTVSFGDFDKDGDQDLISGSPYDNFQYFRNDGDSTKPNFKKVTTSFSSISAGFRCSPFFTDIDNDNDLDIISGVGTAGKVTAYINNGSSFSTNTTIFSGVQVNYQSVPAIADIDNDGDLDILVGSDDQNDTKFFINDGSNNFSLNTTMFAGISFPGSCRPALADIDNDYDYDLIIGRLFGEITYYENKGNPREPIWQLNDTLFAGIEVKQSAHPGFADLDGDGRLDMVIGEYDGNFTYYKNLFAVVTDVKETNNSVPKNFSLEQNYPNPFNPSTTIEFKVAEPGYVSIKIFDALGREVAALVNEFMQPGNYKTSFNTSSFSQRITSGIYFYRLETPSFTQTKKMILLK
ncbi:MAG: hypothetical protein AUK34_07920 [Ignavibacteria bacterium CG2_30_36_16]|nr:MAG: hypothetical protein AUK34_07920 [Ignavibacteria bacterium CG2_30_36_16]